MDTFGNNPQWSMGSISLLEDLLRLNPEKRIDAISAVAHEYFSEDPLPCYPNDIKKFNSSSHEYTSKKKENYRYLTKYLILIRG